MKYLLKIELILACFLSNWTFQKFYTDQGSLIETNPEIGY